MKIILIGRTNWLIDTAKLLVNNGHQIIGIITSRSNLESTINEDDIKNYADLINAKFVYDPKITADKLMSEFDFEQIDIGLSVNYTGIISGDVLNLFKHGVLNAHGGDLPRYRGNACQAWAIINGETNIGICVHKMIGNELDSGKIISRKYVDITIDTRIGQVYKVFDDEVVSRSC
jgi:methionyl-tRNA formyltransferase